MALKAVLVYKNVDSTLDINNKTAYIINRGIFRSPNGAGKVTPSTTNLLVTVDPFIANGRDGLVVQDTQQTTLTLPVPQSGSATYWVALLAKYNSNAAATLQFAFFTDSQVTTSVDADFYIRFARVTVSSGTTTASGATWEFSVGDHSEYLGKNRWRDPVATIADLPLPPNYLGEMPNRDGDVRLVTATYLPYVWVESLEDWMPIGASSNVIINDAKRQLLERDMIRGTHGTGIEGTGPNVAKYADSDISGVLTKSATGLNVSNTPITGGYFVRIAPFRAYVNGHPILTKDTVVTISNPYTGYDLVYLEVCRRPLVTPPGGVIFANNVAPNPPGSTYTYDQIETLIEQVINNTPNFTGSSTQGNFDFTALDVNTDGQYVVTEWRLSVKSNVTVTDVTSFSISAATCAVNLSGFTGNYSAATYNSRIGINSSGDTTTYQGVAYAIPLLIVKRDVAETAPFVPSTTVTNNLSGVNVLNIAPPSDINFSRRALRVLARQDSLASTGAEDFPGGVLKGYKTALGKTNGGAAGPLYVNIPAMSWKLGFPSGTKGPEYLPHGCVVDSTATTTQLQLPAPPSSGARRDFVYLLYWVSTIPVNPCPAGTHVNAVKAFGPTPVTITEYDALGPMTVYAHGIYLAESVGTDAEARDALTTLGFTQTTDGSVWSKNAPAGFSAEQGVDTVYALPVALYHRRNSAVWSITTGSDNFNGSTVGGTLRPEEEFDGTSAKPYDLLDKEVLDCRHATGNIDLQQVLEETMDRLVQGKLATRFNLSPLDSSVANTTQLMVDVLGTNASVTPQLQVAQAVDLDGARVHFSDAIETQVIPWTTAPVTFANTAYPANTYSSSATGASGTVALDVSRGSLDTNLPSGGARPIYELIVGNTGGTSLRVALRIRAPRKSYILSNFQSSGSVNTIPNSPTIDFSQLTGLCELRFLQPSTAITLSPYATVPATSTDQAADRRASTDLCAGYNFRADVGWSNTSTIINEMDAHGRPVDMTVYWDAVDPVLFSPPSLNGNIHVACAFVWDKPRTAYKLGVDSTYYGAAAVDRISGLSLVPKKVYKISGTIRGTAYSSVKVGPLYKVITKTLSATDTFSITTADIGETSVYMYGILDSPQCADGTIVSINKLVSSTNNYPIDGNLSVTLSASVTTQVSVKVAYTSTENRYWFEVCKTSKGLIGPFSWFSDELTPSTSPVGGSVLSTGAASWNTINAAYPLRDPNQFALGLNNQLVSGTYVGAERVPFGLFFLCSAATGYYVCRTSGAYGSHTSPFPSGNFNRTTITVDDKVLDPGRDGGTLTPTTVGTLYDQTSMYFDTHGVQVPSTAAAAANTTKVVLVYASVVPMVNTDTITVLYEGHSYQGIMGDNVSFSTRAQKLQDFIIPDAENDSLKYESTTNVFATSAGTGLPLLDWRDMAYAGAGTGTRSGSSTVATLGAYRSTYYHQELPKRHGKNRAYRLLLQNSRRVKAGETFGKDLAYQTANLAEYDLTMNFIPAPPSQFDTTSVTAASLASGFCSGYGPGIVSDYDQSTLTRGVVGDQRDIGSVPLSFATYANIPDTPATLVEVGPAKAMAGVAGVAMTNGVAATDLDNVSSQGITYWAGTTFNGQGLSNYAMAFTNTEMPRGGYELVRKCTAGTLTTMKSRVGTWVSMAPEKVGRPSADATKSRGTQGVVTARPMVTTSSTYFDPKNVVPCEVPFLPTAADAFYGSTQSTIASTEQSPVLLTQASESLSHQYNLPQAPNNYLYYGQTVPSKYPQFFPEDYSLTLQKVWAFKGSAVNKNNVVTLLVNSGFGSALYRSYERPGANNPGVRPHTGYSADVYQLLYRPVKRK